MTRDERIDAAIDGIVDATRHLEHSRRWAGLATIEADEMSLEDAKAALRQAIAEPAPVVTMIATDERKAPVAAVVNAGWKIIEFAAYGEYLAELGDALEALAKYDDQAALRGADLAPEPEGARDGQ